MRFRCVVLIISFLLSCAAVRDSRAAEKTSLAGAAVVVDLAEPSFVHHAIEDMIGYLLETTGKGLALTNDAKSAKGLRILIGTKAARAVFPEALP
jgi:hypothetical protein